jgi:branched-chain amino acid transport system ATP-binding protein
VSIVLVEQNARMALRLAKTAYVLEVGRITLQGDAKNVARDGYVTEAYLGGS